jgi:hypothetical protein
MVIKLIPKLPEAISWSVMRSVTQGTPEFETDLFAGVVTQRVEVGPALRRQQPSAAKAGFITQQLWTV